MRTKKITRHEAKAQAIAAGINFEADYFTTGIDEKTTLSELRRAAGYRCNSSRGRSENYSFFLSLRDLK
jgi:hypothetical protein